MVKDIGKINFEEENEISAQTATGGGDKTTKRGKILSFLTGGIVGFLLYRSYVKKPTKAKKAFLVVGSLLYSVLLFYIIVGMISLLVAQPLLAQVKELKTVAQEAMFYVKNQDLATASDKVKQVDSKLLETKKSYDRLGYLKYIPLLSAYYQDGQRVVQSARAGTEAADILLGAIAPYADVLGFKGQGSFMGGTAEDRIVKVVETLDKVAPKLDEVVAKVEIIQENIDEINPRRYPKKVGSTPIRSEIEKAKDTIDEARTNLVEIKPVIEVLPSVFGYPEKKKYLVLFQNDGELRPTGGFLTAYSVFEIESGKARSNRSDDIYSLDKKFGNKVDAPEVLEKYLNVQSYHLRDMNFSPDFKVSMEEFLSHYDEIKGTEAVDGVIAIDTHVLKALIDVLGPVEVPGYGEFTTENDPRCNVPQVICALEYIVDEPLPDIVENRKSTILGPMMQEIMFKAYGSPKQVWPSLYQTMITHLKEKHILLYFKDEKNQMAAETFGAAGRVEQADGDYLMIVDANLGGAKSNLYVTSEVEQKYEQTDDGLIKEITINYTHPEPMDNCNLERKSGLCLSGILRDYFRIYVPEGSELIEGMGSESEIKTHQELGKTVFSGFFQLRGDGGRAKIVVRYKLPQAIAQKEDISLFLQKQPGVVETPHQVIGIKDIAEVKLREDIVVPLP